MAWSSVWFSQRIAAIAIIAAFALWPRPAAAQITYGYYADGRLNYMVDSVGNVTEYTYDSDGNLEAVNVSQPTGTAIYDVEPLNGPVGTAVTIIGFGFSTTPSQNTVTFNGTQATVTSSSDTVIETSVPTGATTGNLVVNSPNGQATGPMFIVN